MNTILRIVLLATFAVAVQSGGHNSDGTKGFWEIESEVSRRSFRTSLGMEGVGEMVKYNWAPELHEAKWRHEAMGVDPEEAERRAVAEQWVVFLFEMFFRGLGALIKGALEIDS